MLESSLDCKEIQPVHSKGDQPWVFFGRTDTEAETPILWPPQAKSWLTGKDSDAGRAWGQEEKGMTEDEMAGWHHWLDGREFGWTPGVDGGQGGLACCSSWGHKESDMTEQLNWTQYWGKGICPSKQNKWWIPKSTNFTSHIFLAHPGLTLGVLFLKFAGNKESYPFVNRLFPKDMEAL